MDGSISNRSMHNRPLIHIGNGYRTAMSSTWPSQRFCAAQFRFSL